jgi:hypothetical protein
VQNHGDRHDEGNNVHGGSGALEDDGVGEFDVTGVAVGVDAGDALRDRVYGAY